MNALQRVGLTYVQARQIFLEIYNYPKTVSKYQELGLTAEEANALYTVISADVDQYSEAESSYKRDFWIGLIMTVVGLTGWLLLGREVLGKSAFIWVGGLGMLYLWYGKRKIVKRYEAIDAELDTVENQH